ncbi:HK97-gp10 family putative phage morphogenesis protein [Pelagibacterium sp.]|uniref:HK97-gp10 family putative phage morphogenesis protein n=1 Tax=Pelagibacterium sp. TaxID=1967288 RepID=UPI003A92906B
MAKTVRVEGLKEIDAALADLSKATARNILRRTGIKALEPVAATARNLAPDDPATSGNDLKSSITVGTKLSPRQAKIARSNIRRGLADKSFVEVYAGPGPDPAAHNQEFGNINHGPQPFMRPAWAGNKDKVLDIVKTESWAEIEKAAKRAERKAARLAAKAARS